MLGAEVGRGASCLIRDGMLGLVFILSACIYASHPAGHQARSGDVSFYCESMILRGPGLLQ